MYDMYNIPLMIADNEQESKEAYFVGLRRKELPSKDDVFKE